MLSRVENVKKVLYTLRTSWSQMASKVIFANHANIVTFPPPILALVGGSFWPIFEVSCFGQSLKKLLRYDRDRRADFRFGDSILVTLKYLLVGKIRLKRPTKSGRNDSWPKRLRLKRPRPKRLRLKRPRPKRLRAETTLGPSPPPKKKGKVLKLDLAIK